MKKRRVRRVFRDKGCVTEATQGEMAMDELNKTIHAGLLDRGKDNDRYDALVKAADVVEDELARVLKDIYPGSGKPSLNIQPISYRILQFDVFTPDHVEFNIEAIPSRGGDATIYNLKVEFPFGDDQLEDEKYDAIKKLRGGHGNIKSIKGVLNLIKQGGSLYKSQTGPLAAEPEAQAQLPFGESKMKKITKSKLNAIIKEEIENVVGSLQEDNKQIRINQIEFLKGKIRITAAMLSGQHGELQGKPGAQQQLKAMHEKNVALLKDFEKRMEERGADDFSVYTNLPRMKGGLTGSGADGFFEVVALAARKDRAAGFDFIKAPKPEGLGIKIRQPQDVIRWKAIEKPQPKAAEPEAKPGLIKRTMKAIGLGNRPEDY